MQLSGHLDEQSWGHVLKVPSESLDLEGRLPGFQNASVIPVVILLLNRFPDLLSPSIKVEKLLRAVADGDLEMVSFSESVFLATVCQNT